VSIDVDADRRRRIRSNVWRLVAFVLGVYVLFIVVFLNKGS